MITLLIWLLFLVIIFGLVIWLIQFLPVPEPFGRIAMVIIALIFILILLGALMGGVPLPAFRGL